MNKSARLQTAREFAHLTMGAIIYDLGISLFLDPHKLAPGGVSGISVIISHLSNGLISTGILIFLLNLPLLCVAYFKLGKKLVLRTLYCLAVVAAVDRILPLIVGNGFSVVDDLLLNTLAGSGLMSLGVGLVFHNGGTTGGTDIVVKFLRTRYKYIRTGTFFLLIDTVIVTASGIVFGDIKVAMYAGVSVIVQSILLDRVLYGRDGAALVFIISDSDNVIAERMLSEIECGITIINGKGAYTNTNKNVLLTAVHKQNLPKVRDIVRDVDERAFMIISSASTVLGEGFRSHKSEDL